MKMALLAGATVTRTATVYGAPLVMKRVPPATLALCCGIAAAGLSLCRLGIRHNRTRRNFQINALRCLKIIEWE
jgi:hypothetical protein